MEGDLVRAGGVVRLDTVPEAASLQGLLEWCYSGMVAQGINGDNVADLLQASQAFGVEDLNRACERFLLDGLCAENAHDILDLANDHVLSKVAAEARLVIARSKV